MAHVWLAEVSQRAFVCRGCLGSIGSLTATAAGRRPTTTTPPWTTTLPQTTVRTVRKAAQARWRRRQLAGTPTRRADVLDAPVTPTATATATAGAPPAEGNRFTLPTMDELKRGLKAMEATTPDRLGRSDDDVTVRYFEQLQDGTVVKASDPRTVESQLARQMAELEGKMADTERLVGEMQQRRQGVVALTPAQRRAERMRRRLDAIRALDAESRQIDAEAEQDAGGALAQELAAVRVADHGAATTARRHIKNLNQILRTCARRLRFKPATALDAKLIAIVWSRWNVAQNWLRMHWTHVPAGAWAMLWRVLAHDGGAAENPKRMSHIFFLTRDMAAAGVPMTDAQELLAVEAMFIEGWQADALDNWRRLAARLGSRPATAVAYWELGLRMYSIHGDVERAVRAADHLFDGGLERDGLHGAAARANPRVLFQLIRSAAAHGHEEVAWTTFRRLQRVLAARTGTPQMGLEDYDEVVAAFLSANHTEYAFDVFVDMMFAGRVDARQRGHVGDHVIDKSPGDDAPPRLPSRTANQFFFGKWLKRLIGAGDVDGAYQVMRFAQRRGVTLAAVQVNGLLGAWLRAGTAAEQAKADALAWRMIAARQRFVELRRRERAVDWPLQLQGRRTRNDEAPWHGERADVPRASVETFLLMADNYKNRGQIALVERLWEAFRACELASADAFMMNQLLESYLQQGRAHEVRRLYASMVHGDARVMPNANTFIAMARSLTIHRNVAALLTDDERRRAGAEVRALTAEMAAVAPRAFGNSSGRPQALVDPREAAYYQALGRSLLHAARKAGDFVLVVVLLQALPRLLATADAFRVPRFRVSGSLAVELVAGVSTVENKYYQRDTPEARQRIFKASEVVDALLKDVRQGIARPYGTPAPLSDAPEDRMSHDLATVLAHFYRLKCDGVSDADFAILRDEAVQHTNLEAYV